MKKIEEIIALVKEYRVAKHHRAARQILREIETLLKEEEGEEVNEEEKDINSILP